MELIRGMYNLLPRHRGSVLTIGNYDGLHRGHRAVIARVCELAGQAGLKSTVLTFEPLPREYFDGDDAPGRVQTLRDRLEGLAALGIDQALCLRFDESLATTAPEEFAGRALRAGLETHRLVVGEDFRFGRDRRGDLALLGRLGVKVEIATTVRSADGERVSSTRIRERLAAGDLDGTAALLGRPWAVRGRVVHGAKRGRVMGYPTLNMRPGRLALAHGIYAARVTLPGGECKDGVASWGVRPAVGGDTRVVLEAHLFDFDAELYGERLTVEPSWRLRDERDFDGMDALKAQIGKDIELAREWFAARSAAPTDGNMPSG